MVLGISADSIDDNLKFKNKHKFPFDLLSDQDLKMSTKYGVCKPGEERTPRASILIGPGGEIIETFPNVDPNNHAQEVLETVRNTK